MNHRTIRVAVVAILTTLGLLVPVGMAQANHDPNPPYLTTSQPGGFELYGFHHKQLSATVHAWIGLQRHPNGAYRWWGKVQGDGRQLSATFDDTLFNASPNTWGPADCFTGRASTVYCYGGWHHIVDLAYVSTDVAASYTGGSSTGFKCLESYIIRKGQRTPYAGARPGC